MNLASVGRKLVIGSFVAALMAPLTAVGLSGQVRSAASALVANPHSWPEQSNRLRAATPLWNDAVAGYSTMLYRLGTSSNQGVGVVGRDGWMFLGDIQNANFSQAIGRRTFSDAELTAWTSTLSAEKQWLAARRIPLVFAVGPAKWSVYPDKLPTWAGSAHRTIFDQVQAAAPDLGIVDLRPALRDARSTADTYSRLNSHWTDYGAYIGWGQLADAIDAAVPGADVVRPKASGVATRQDGPNEFDAMMGVRAPNPWTSPNLSGSLGSYAVVQPDGSLAQQSGDPETNLLDLPRTTVNTQAPNKLTALVLRDSMGDALTPYLQASFARTVQVRHYIDLQSSAPNVQALVDLVHPDVVIVEMAERHFNSGLPDGPMWAAANAYDKANAASEASWVSDKQASATLSVEGTLSTTAATKVAWSSARPGTQLLRVSLNASGPGALQVLLGDGAVQTLRVAQDSNVVFLQIPAGQATNGVSLQLAPGSAPAVLTSVSVRTS